MDNTVQMAYTFDATKHDPSQGFDPIPGAVYNMQVTDTGIVKLKDDANNQPKGWGFKIETTVVDGEYKGRKVYKQFNLGNTASEQNAQIAHKELSALSHVTGVFVVKMENQGAELRNARFKAEVTNDGKYNDIKSFMDVNGNKPGKVGHGNSVATPVAVATPSVGFGAAPAPAAQAPQAATSAAWGATTGAVAPAAAPTPPAAAPQVPVASAFPPEGWTQHPDNPAYYYKGAEVVSGDDLKARYAAPATPTAPAAPAFADPTPQQQAWTQQPPAAGAAPGNAPWGAPA